MLRWGPAVLFCLLCLAPPRAEAASYAGPLFDCHTHIMPIREGGRGAPERGAGPRGRGRFGEGRRGAGEGRRGEVGVTPEEMVSILRQNGISGVILMGPRTLTRRAEEAAPGFVRPFVEVPRDPETREFLRSDESLAEIEAQIRAGLRGIGEVSLRHLATPRGPASAVAADDPWMLRVYDLAARYGVPVNVHVEAEYSDELDRALAHNPGATILWAHAGDADAAKVGALMRRHPNLYADISCRNPFFERARPRAAQSLADESGLLKEEWRLLFEEFPDRFLFGLDLGSGDRHTRLGEVIPFYRSVLGQLTLSTAGKIGHANAQRLLGP